MNNSEIEETLARITAKLERLEISHAQIVSRLNTAIDYLNTLAVLAVTANDEHFQRRRV
jgi:hypothetical protein